MGDPETALRPWLRHHVWCNCKTDDPPSEARCKCGLRAALAASQEPESGGLAEALRGDGPCADCGTLDNIVWFTDNVFWNAVTGENVVHEESRAKIICVTCFVQRTADAGLHPTGWRLLPDWPWREHIDGQ